MADNFACLKIGYLHDPTYVRVRTITDVPCHLTCYYTDKDIRKHPESRTIRGLTVPWGVYFCVTSYLSVEQEEPGDTLIHTFTIPNWPICEYRNFIFAGTVAGVESPSCSPIFNHHNSGWPPIFLILRPYASGAYNNISGQIGDLPPNHYKNLKEAIPDEDATCVYCDGYPATHWELDTYRIPLLDPRPADIASITHFGRFRRQGGMAYVYIARPSILQPPGFERGPEYNYFPETYEDRSWTLTQNPWTLKPWQRADLDTLQIGIELNWYWGVGWASTGYCTQLYLQVNFDFTYT